jgi:hypothetical protein
MGSTSFMILAIVAGGESVAGKLLRLDIFAGSCITLRTEDICVGEMRLEMSDNGWLIIILNEDLDCCSLLIQENLKFFLPPDL